MFIVDIPFGVQESHEDPAHKNSLILNTGLEGNNKSMWINSLLKKPVFSHSDNIKSTW